MAQYPAAGTNTFRLVTKADTASSTSLGSATVTSDSGVSGTYGAWYQIIASTAAESYITELSITITASAPPVASDLPLTLQLGTGGAGSEVVKFDKVLPLTTVVIGQSYVVRLDVPFRVTASKRIAARTKASSTGVKDLTVGVYGLPISQTEGN